MLNAQMKEIQSRIVGFNTFFSLPLLQGPSYAFLPPIIAMMKIPEFQCPSFKNIGNLYCFIK